MLRRTLQYLEPVRDRVLDGAALKLGDTVLDVGCGDGLLGFGALPRVGPQGTVIFSDVSAGLVETCREAATRLGQADRCQFTVGALPDLAGLPDNAADVVLTRSVLIYINDKAAAFRALHRVLRPAGRLSIFEPINRYSLAQPPGQRFGFDVRGAEAAVDKLIEVYRGDAPDADPMVDFDERDLLAHAEAAGFTELRLTLEVEADVRSELPTRDWQTYLRTAPNPTAPTFGEALAALDAPDRATLENCLRPQVEAGTVRNRMAVTYLTAQRER